VQNDDPWPLREDSVISAFFAPTRNFFTGALVPGIGKQRSAPAFYSAAAVPREKYTLWVFSGVDGQLYLLDGVNQTEARVPWGSSIAGVHASCRSGWQVLSSALETSNGDSVQAFEFPDREPQAVSQRLPVNGTIVALWGGTAQDSANLVDRSFETGDYEAVQLTVNCHQ
jgi:hypothetical protein